MNGVVVPGQQIRRVDADFTNLFAAVTVTGVLLVQIQVEAFRPAVA